jgi:hypothetical protein
MKVSERPLSRHGVWLETRAPRTNVENNHD